MSANRIFGRIRVSPQTAMLLKRMDTIPVASNNNTETVKDAQGEGSDETSGHGTESEEGALGEEALSGENAEEDDATQRAASYDSASMWAAIGSPGIPTSQTLPEEDQVARCEDGEVFEDEEDQGPPSNQEANRTMRTEEPQGGNDEDLGAYAGEHRRFVLYPHEEPTARKRSWNGSVASDEDRRSARRPKITTQDGSPAIMLPPI
ncbi:hypothetical protein K466DRAFT_601477 [Polyporus arcularius HHB13444]|uniref:Uncharacterized protein n=1 Tax=Polyporus arcularius HHB13444 TaxID=1314778 RepID=A0A5C3P610_9APHY|nr:hypothetical protein K466DRAFT_601477 [Polyporus arcularius HHB13444]